MFKQAGTGSNGRRAGYVLIKCGKIALVLRLVCTYPVALASADGGSFNELLLLIAVVAFSLTALLAWERVAPFITRHPMVLALDIVLSLLVFASASTPTAYMGYLGSTAVIIGLFFPLLGQVLLTSLLVLGFLLVVAITSGGLQQLVSDLPIIAASVVLFVGLTYVGNSMQQLQRQVDVGIEQARTAAAEAALGQERSRLARELHDSLVKSLEGISLQAKAMVMAGKSVDEASTISAAATESIQQSRQLLKGLREDSVPPLAASLQDMADEFAAMHGITVDLQVSDCLDLPLEVRYAAYKVAEEAMSNAVEHSGADRVECRATYAESVLQIVVQDRGRGFTSSHQRQAQNGNHFGLTGMRERAEELDGALRLESRQGQGTQVVLTIPVAEQKERV